jgi:hypothetical protein
MFRVSPAVGRRCAPRCGPDGLPPEMITPSNVANPHSRPCLPDVSLYTHKSVISGALQPLTGRHSAPGRVTSFANFARSLHRPREDSQFLALTQRAGNASPAGTTAEPDEDLLASVYSWTCATLENTRISWFASTYARLALVITACMSISFSGASEASQCFAYHRLLGRRCAPRCGPDGLPPEMITPSSMANPHSLKSTTSPHAETDCTKTVRPTSCPGVRHGVTLSTTKRCRSSSLLATSRRHRGKIRLGKRETPPAKPADREPSANHDALANTSSGHLARLRQSSNFADP